MRIHIVFRGSIPRLRESFRGWISSPSVFSQANLVGIHLRKDWEKLVIHLRKYWRNLGVTTRKTKWIPLLLGHHLVCDFLCNPIFFKHIKDGIIIFRQFLWLDSMKTLRDTLYSSRKPVRYYTITVEIEISKSRPMIEKSAENFLWLWKRRLFQSRQKNSNPNSEKCW